MHVRLKYPATAYAFRRTQGNYLPDLCPLLGIAWMQMGPMSVRDATKRRELLRAEHRHTGVGRRAIDGRQFGHHQIS